MSFAAALAAADAGPSRGTDLITAVGLGNELLCRFGLAIEPKGTGADSKWFLSQLFGYLGAAITAGLVLGLDDDELVNALGLAYMEFGWQKSLEWGRFWKREPFLPDLPRWEGFKPRY